MTVEFTCFECQHNNYRAQAGVQGVVEVEFKFYNFSDAHRHMIEHPQHTVDIAIIKEDNDG